MSNQSYTCIESSYKKMYAILICFQFKARLGKKIADATAVWSLQFFRVFAYLEFNIPEAYMFVTTVSKSFVTLIYLFFVESLNLNLQDFIVGFIFITFSLPKL